MAHWRTRHSNRGREDKAPCGRSKRHVEPCQHAPVEMTIVIENDFERYHTFDYEGQEKREEKDRVRTLIETEMSSRKTDIGDINVGTIYDTQVQITVDVECHCYDRNKDVIKKAKKEVPDFFYVKDDTPHVVDRMSI